MLHESTHGLVITLAGSVPDLDDQHPSSLSPNPGDRSPVEYSRQTARALCLATNRTELNDFVVI
jgi:hypothetical protein